MISSKQRRLDTHDLAGFSTVVDPKIKAIIIYLRPVANRWYEAKQQRENEDSAGEKKTTAVYYVL